MRGWIVSSVARKRWGLRTPCIILARKFLVAQELAGNKETNMKNAIRLVVLMLGLVTTYVAVAAPVLPAPDGGPIPLCGPKSKSCD